MAFFGVTLETIGSTKHHSNADRLDICTLKGMDFQFVTLRNQFKVGDRVIYFPLESLLPQDILEKLGLVGKLAGSNRNRVKTATLRGELSQGIVSDPTKFLTQEQLVLSPEEITELLGVTKYEPEPNAIRAGILLPLPEGTSVYDIEGADRYTEITETLMDQLVQITEKIEGSNASTTLATSGQILVNMRNNTIQPVPEEEHYFWTTAREIGLLDKLPQVKEWMHKQPHLEKFHNQNVTIYGEICGPKEQGNIYQLKTRKILVFDIRTDRGFLPVKDFTEITNLLAIETVPILAHGITLREWLEGKTVKEASNGPSKINSATLREGIVIKPLEDGRWAKGRLILKQHSPQYLAKH